MWMFSVTTTLQDPLLKSNFKANNKQFQSIKNTLQGCLGVFESERLPHIPPYMLKDCRHVVQGKKRPTNEERAQADEAGAEASGAAGAPEALASENGAPEGAADTATPEAAPPGEQDTGADPPGEAASEPAGDRAVEPAAKRRTRAQRTPRSASSPKAKSSIDGSEQDAPPRKKARA